MEESWKEVPYYWVEFAEWKNGDCLTFWGCRISKRYGKHFNRKVAEELLAKGNTAYKERFNKEADFNILKADLTDYEYNENRVFEYEKEGTLDISCHEQRHKTTRTIKYDTRNNSMRVYINETLRNEFSYATN